MTTDRRASGSQGQPSRRQFARVVAGTAAGLFAAPGHLRARGANEKLNIAMIACGGRGAHNLGQMKGENIVALCDVFQPAVDRAARDHPGAIQCNDFRVLFDKHSSKFDAVVVSTPEHTHAFATLPALALGKHVYCEKPLTRDVHEARLVRLAAEKAKVVTQMGNQNHSNDSYRKVIELIRTGVIGPVTEAHVWVSRAWGWQSAEDAEKNKDIVSVRERPEGASPVPNGLNWDLWVGPAPDRPYHEVYFPGPKWYRWWDFGNGTMSDLGSHMNDMPFWALDLKAPKTIEAFGPPAHPEIAPASMHVTYEYDARGDMPPVKLHWYQGVDKPPIWTRGEIPQWRDGILYVGPKGMILADHRRHLLLLEDTSEGFQPPAETIPRSPGHWAEWIANCKTGAACGSNFDYAGWLTEANHLGNVAYRVGKKITWDPVSMTAINASEAEPFLRRAYRAGWTLG
jgi:predicted dehydrogenase